MSSEIDNRDQLDVVINEEDYIRYLENKIKTLENERKNLLLKLNYYRSELDKLLASPLIEAVVENVLEDGKVVVKSSTGPTLVVTVSESIDKSRIIPGARVALNQGFNDRGGSTRVCGRAGSVYGGHR